MLRVTSYTAHKRAAVARQIIKIGINQEGFHYLPVMKSFLLEEVRVEPSLALRKATQNKPAQTIIGDK